MRHDEKAKAELQAELADLRQLVTELKSTIRDMEGEAAHCYMTPQRLRESEQQYRALVEEAIQGVSIVVGYNRVYANLTLATMLGYDRPEELIGMHVWDDIVPSSLEEIRRLGETRRRGETTPEWYTYQRRKKDGTPIWVEQRVVPIVWEGHDAYLVTMVDVSDRKQMEEALQHAYQTLEDRVEARTAALQLANSQLQEEIDRRQKVENTLWQSHAHFNALLDHNADIICVIDAEGVISYYSPAVERVLDYRPEALLGRHIYGDIHPNDIPHVKASISKVLQHPGLTQRVEYRARHRDGSWRDFEALASSPADGLLTGEIVINGRDVSERKQAERALEESEARFRHVLENAVQGFLVQRNLQPLFANRALANQYGYATPEEILRLGSIEELIAPSDRDRLVAYNQARLEGRSSPSSYEFQGLRQDGSVVSMENFVTTVIWESEPAILVSSIDVSERKRTESVRKRLQAQLHQSQKLEALGTLASGIAHDFNNHLSVISMSAQTLALEPVKTEEANEAIDRLQQTSQRGTALVDQILAFGRQSQPSRQPVVVSEIIEEALTFLRASLPSSIEFNTSINPESGMVLADATQLYQVLVNLGINAGQAMQESVKRLEVSLDSVELDATSVRQYPELRPGPHVCLTVSDTGQGMAPEVMARCFDPFFTTKGVDSGTEMGLAVVHGIVASHEGVIRVESRVGLGTSFFVYLPSLSLSDQVVREEMPEPSIVVPDTVLRACVLVIDDEKALAMGLKAVLQRYGHEAVVSTQSNEALELFRATPNRYDIVVTDYIMPGFAGDILIQEMRSIRADIPIVLCTGDSPSSIVDLARELRVDALLTKPFSGVDVVKAIERVLAQRAADKLG